MEFISLIFSAYVLPLGHYPNKPHLIQLDIQMLKVSKHTYLNSSMTTKQVFLQYSYFSRVYHLPRKIDNGRT